MPFSITQAFAFISTLVLFARANQISIPTPLRAPCDNPEPATPVRPFTVKAFQSPYPDGQGLTGLSMAAHSGNFFLTNQVPASNETVIWVDGHSLAFLHHPQLSQIFIDASSGALHYSLMPHTPDPPGASYVLFAHNGEGTETYRRGTRNGWPYITDPPGAFNWLGSWMNSYWFACPQAGGEYLLKKSVTTVGETWEGGCTVLTLAAIDWEGV